MKEEVEHPRSKVSATEFADWQQKEYEGILRELQSPSSGAANKEVIKTRWVLKPQGEGVKARFAIKILTRGKTRTTICMREHQLQCRSIWFWLWQQNGAALGSSQTIACLDVATAFLHAEMKDEVFVKMDADTPLFV